MQNYSMNLPSYSIGEKVYDKVAQICAPFGTKAVVIGGKTAMSVAKEELLAGLANTDITIMDFIYYGGEASFENVDSLLANEKVQNCDMIFAVGGGKALDTAKAAAEMAKKPIFAFPTIAATCAATTSVSIMYYPDGRFKRPFFLTAPPTHTFINLRIIAQAPYRYIWAGMGDTYAKHYEATVSARGDELKHYHAMGVQLSRMCVDPLLKYGKAALDANKAGIVNNALEEVVLAIIVTTGICSIFLTSEQIIDYNTGLAHGIFYALTSYPQIEKEHLHGEVVGYGVLILLLCDNNREEFKNLLNFCRQVELPTKLKGMDIALEELDNIIAKTLEMKDIEHNPYIITKAMLKEAFLELENI